MIDDRDEIDDEVRRALGSLQAPDGYFDDLAERTLARLDEEPAELADDVADDAVIGEARDEDSGLRDIQSLASEAVARVRSSSPAVPRSPSVSAAFRVVALPRSPAVTEAADPPDELARQRALRVAPPTGNPSVPKPVPDTVARPRRWYAASGVAVAAAAALVVFVSVADRGEDAARRDVATGERTLTHAASGERGEAAAPPAQIAAVGAGSAAGSASAARSDVPPLDSKPVAVADRPVIAERPKVGPKGKTAAPTYATKKPAPKRGGGGGPGDEPIDAISKNEAPPSTPTSPPSSPTSPPGDSKPDEIQRAVEAAPGEGRVPVLAKKSLTADDITRTLAAVAPAAKRCYVGTAGAAIVTATVAPSGQVTRVVVSGPFAGTPTAACVDRAVRAARFPAWDGSPQTIKYSYLLSE